MKRGILTKIAKKTGLSLVHISSIVNRRKLNNSDDITKPSWETAKKLFQVTGIPIEIWMEGSSEDIKSLLKTSQKVLN